MGQLEDILSDAINSVFAMNGLGEDKEVKLLEDPHEVINNHPGDMVVEYVQHFPEDEELKIAVLNLTLSTKYETEINEYFHSSQVYIARTATVIVLIDDIHLLHVWKQEETVWSTSIGTALIIVIIVVVLTAIIWGAACMHCRKRRENFETTLPKSKAHKQRVQEAQKRKEEKKKNRKGRKGIAYITNQYKKYKALRNIKDEETDNENEQIGMISNETKPQTAI